jgi:hypothetical protein
MTFSNVNIFRNTVNTLNTSGSNKTADKIATGGAFSPTTFEAVSLIVPSLIMAGKIHILPNILQPCRTG